jgi:hypothetical protein
MELTFDDAIRVGLPTDLLEVQRGGVDAAATVPSSKRPRGLALSSLTVSRNWDGLWGMLRRRQRVYFLSVAFDLSGGDPVILPPADVPANAVHEVQRGETISFTLGMGAPVFPPRAISGGLIVYLVVCEADKTSKHIGEVLAQVHDDLNHCGSLADVISQFSASPAATVTTEVLKAATAAIQPVATILKNGRDEFAGVFNGIFPARGSWRDRLVGTSNGTTIVLTELR